jgi:hypothetical protein
VGLAVGEDLADVIDRPLYLVDVPTFLRSTTRAVLTTWVVDVTYRTRVSSGSSEARIGGLEMSALRSSSAFCISFIERKESDIFNSLYRGSQCSPSRDMKWLSAVRHPMSRWSSLMFQTWPISAMVEILSGFALMPCSVTMYPRSLPRGTPKLHF